MGKAKDYARMNPVFARPQTGVASNHSSTVPSTEHSYDSDHPQADDALADVGDPQDPNLSGKGDTESPYTWMAGQLSGWCENDDYRTFFENSTGPDSRLVPFSNDGDYDDNGGHAVAIGHSYGQHSTKSSTEGSPDESYPVGIIVRRV